MAVLEAVTQVPRDHPAGFIGWSFYYQAPEEETILLLMQGNDALRRGVCYYETDGLWKPGTYALYVCRFHPINLVPLRHGHRVWVIREQVPRIGCGTVCDSLPPIRL